ncbi:hypothetical protein [Nonomuraea sp. NPDC003804]|uniref:hypothetical protein n=1 Tax=Nonomuraea sp. NPDC003804 TaxID=3154547 RepID=UPI0033A123FE
MLDGESGAAGPQVKYQARPAGSPLRRSRLGDLRMRVVYQVLAVVAALAVLVAGGLAIALSGGADEGAARPVAAPPAVPSSSAPSPPASAASTPGSSPAASPGSTGAPATASPAASPAATVAGSSGAPSTAPSAVASVPSGAAATAVPSGVASAVPSGAPSAAPSVVPSAVAAPVASATPSPGASIAPGYTALEALAADRRVPKLPGRIRLRALTGKPVATMGVIKDAKTGVSVPRLRAPWKRYGAAPFTSRQVLPKAGAGPRAMLVSCPVPIEAQQRLRDTALLAARWTLNHHPKGAVIRWLGAQPIKKGWTLYYQVKYGKRASVAAVAVLDTGKARPALVFVTIPDTQKKRWADIRRVMSGVRVLG